MIDAPHTTTGWRWPVRLAAAGTASMLVVVGYLADLGGTETRATPVRQVSDPAQLSPASTVLRSDSPAAAHQAAPVQATQARPTPDAAVLDWLDAIGQGDWRTAAELVGPKSRRYIESLGGNVEGLMRESAEGYGPWARTADRATTEIELGVVDGAPATIVVVTGTPRGEGREGFSSDAIPAVRTDAGWVVEPTAFRSDTGGRLEMVNPSRSRDGGLSAMTSGDTISASALGSGDFFFSLEDQPAVRVEGAPAGGGTRATWDPEGAMATGRNLLVVAYADGETLTAFAGVVEVE